MFSPNRGHWGTNGLTDVNIGDVYQPTIINTVEQAGAEAGRQGTRQAAGERAAAFADRVQWLSNSAVALKSLLGMKKNEDPGFCDQPCVFGLMHCAGGLYS